LYTSFTKHSNDMYTHFRADEHAFVEKVSDWIEQAGLDHAVKRSDFLDPRQAYILTLLAQKASSVKVNFSGGYDGAERKRAIIAPDYMDIASADYAIQVLNLGSGDGKFVSLNHSDYMGAILNLGVKREKIGDIHALETGCHILVAKEVSSYIQSQMTQVNRLKVNASIIELDQLTQSPLSMDQVSLTVASMRLDGIISEVYRLSRAKAQVPIKAGKCKVNWQVAENPSKILKENDLVSLQGFGRFKLLQIEGRTKKDNVRVLIGRFK